MQSRHAAGTAGSEVGSIEEFYMLALLYVATEYWPVNLGFVLMYVGFDKPSF